MQYYAYQVNIYIYYIERKKNSYLHFHKVINNNNKEQKNIYIERHNM